MPESLKIIIYRVIQESLHNIVKHSKAVRVVLSLVSNNTAIELMIKDNGQGFNPAAILVGGVCVDWPATSHHGHKTDLPTIHLWKCDGNISRRILDAV